MSHPFDVEKGKRLFLHRRVDLGVVLQVQVVDEFAEHRLVVDVEISQDGIPVVLQVVQVL